MSVSRSRVEGSFDKAGGSQVATVEIDRARGLFSVRPLRSRRVYTLPLSTVAEIVCHRVIITDMPAKKVRSVRRGLL
jgi:hypothetical protein